MVLSIGLIGVAYELAGIQVVKMRTAMGDKDRWPCPGWAPTWG